MEVKPLSTSSVRAGYKQTEVGVVPEEWESCRLADLLDGSRSIRYGIVQPGKFDSAGCFMLRSQDYSKGWAGPDNMHRVNRALAVEEKIARTLEFQQQLLRIIGVLGMPIILFSDWVLTLQYSPRFADASMVLFLFIVAQVFTQLAGIYQALLMGLDASWAYALSVMIGQGVYITLTWVLTPTYGLSGVGVAALVSGCLLFVLTGLQLRRRFQMGFSRRLVTSTLYCVGALLAAGWVNTYLDSSNFTVIAGRIAFYGVFVGSLWLITRQEPNPVYEDQPVLEKTPQG